MRADGEQCWLHTGAAGVGRDGAVGPRNFSTSEALTTDTLRTPLRDRLTKRPFLHYTILGRLVNLNRVQLSLQSSSPLQKLTEANLSQMNGGTGTLKLVTEVGVEPDIETDSPAVAGTFRALEPMIAGLNFWPRQVSLGASNLRLPDAEQSPCLHD